MVQFASVMLNNHMIFKQQENHVDQLHHLNLLPSKASLSPSAYCVEEEMSSTSSGSGEKEDSTGSSANVTLNFLLPSLISLADTRMEIGVTELLVELNIDEGVGELQDDVASEQDDVATDRSETESASLSVSWGTVV